MINNKHVYTRTLREEENIEYDDLVSTYISTSDYSLNVKDYENELSKDRVTLTNTKNPKGNLYANQSWIIEIAGLSVDNADNTLLNNVKYSKVILKDGSIKNLTKSDCKAIAETLYNSIQRYTDITAFLHNELYDYKQNRPLMDKVAECWKGNGKFHIDAIEPKNEDYLSLPIDANGTTQPITNPKDFSEFIMYYLKDWYNVVRFANTSLYIIWLYILLQMNPLKMDLEKLTAIHLQMSLITLCLTDLDISWYSQQFQISSAPIP